MKLLFLSLFFFCIGTIAFGQYLRDDFTSKERFSKNWVGDVELFDISDGHARSNNQEVQDTFGIQSLNWFARDRIYELTTRFDLEFETSSANYIDLTLFKTDQQSVFLRFGGKDDNVQLMHSGAESTDILNADHPKITGKNQFDVRVKYVHLDDSLMLKIDFTESKTGSWIKWSEFGIPASSDSFKVGLSIRQSTASFFGKHVLRSFELNDVQFMNPPKLIRSEISDPETIVLQFDQKVQRFSNLEVYVLNEKINTSQTIWIDNQLLEINLKQALKKSPEILISGICNRDQNCLNDTGFVIPYSPPSPGFANDVIITEIMADPDPQVELPSCEYLEIYNASNEMIVLQGWKLSDPGTEIELPSDTLLPGSYALIAERQHKNLFSQAIKIIGVDRLPSLNNSGDSLTISNGSGVIIFQVDYSLEDYDPPWKNKGGWSLEMIDVNQPCLSSNWTASKDKAGGTPGAKNSVVADIVDKEAPFLQRVELVSEFKMHLEFSEPIDGSVPSFTFDPVDFAIDSFVINGNLLSIAFVQPLSDRIVKMNVHGIWDCSGNDFQDTTIRLSSWSTDALQNLRINEIMFDPGEGCAEYLEIVNAGSGVVDLSSLAFGQMDDGGSWEDLEPLIDYRKLLFPGEYICFVSDVEALRSCFPERMNSTICEAQVLPALPSEACIGVGRTNGELIDSFSYSEKMHLSWLPDSKGVSLERIDFSNPNNFSNWGSASFNTGYGTPGYENSNYHSQINSKGSFQLNPDPFSPDSDGYHDLLKISWLGKSGSHSVSIRIIDLNGRSVANPVVEEHVHSEVSFHWAGTDDMGGLLEPGIYLVELSVIDEDGKSLKFCKPVTLLW